MNFWLESMISVRQSFIQPTEIEIAFRSRARVSFHTDRHCAPPFFIYPDWSSVIGTYHFHYLTELPFQLISKLIQTQMYVVYCLYLYIKVHMFVYRFVPRNISWH